MFHSIIKIDVDDWDALVNKTYNRPYSFQQQDGCKNRGVFEFTVPVKDPYDYINDTVPEKVNDPDMGVSFKAWLSRNPSKKLKSKGDQNSWSLGLWWDRNFYPSVDMIINDLHKQGLLPAGNYLINIDW